MKHGEYNNVVVDNFFKYLKRNHITQKKYAEDNNMDESTLSKWKNGSSSPTLDQVKQAAQYFAVTVNDLVYADQEKRKLEVLIDKSYDPIIAQQSVKVKLYSDYFKKPLKVLILYSLIFTILIFVVFLVRNNFPYLSLLILLGIPSVILITYISSYEEKTYIINYLDDIFYRRKDATNKSYIWSLIIRIISALIFIYYTTLFIDVESTNEVQKGLLTALSFLLLFLLFSAFFSITNLHKKFKLEIYDNEIAGYFFSKVFLSVHFSISSLAVLLSISDFQKYLAFLIVSTIMLGINAFDFFMVSLEFSKYVLVYQENEKDPRELFPKKY